VTPDHPTYAVRVSGPGASGHYFDHVFDSRAEAVTYAGAVARMGPERIRELSALPRRWAGDDSGGRESRRSRRGNPVTRVRVDEIPPNTMMLRSGVAPQPEAALPAGVITYGGGGSQVQMTYGQLGGKQPSAVYETPVVTLHSERAGATAIAMEEARRKRDEEALDEL
jgi:hypothetical protein